MVMRASKSLERQLRANGVLPPKEKAAHVFTIPNYRPPLLNQLIFGSVRRRCRLMNECHEMFAVYARFQDVPKATGKRRVSLEITLGPRQKESDADSLWKSTLDALVRVGLLLGDGVHQVQLGTISFTRGERQTLVRLEDLPGGS